MILKTDLGRLCIAVCLVAAGLTGCDKKEEAPPQPNASDRAAEEIIRRTQDPQNKAKALEAQMLEHDRQRRESLDKM